jgi:hypothetical protein
MNFCYRIGQLLLLYDKLIVDSTTVRVLYNAMSADKFMYSRNRLGKMILNDQELVLPPS